MICTKRDTHKAADVLVGGTRGISGNEESLVLIIVRDVFQFPFHGCKNGPGNGSVFIR